MLSRTQAAQKGFPPLQKSADIFLFGDSQPVKELHDAFSLAIRQQKETADCLDVYLNRVALWEEYFELLDAALGWFDPFKQVAESDIDKFREEEESHNAPSRVKLQVGYVHTVSHYKFICRCLNIYANLAQNKYSRPMCSVTLLPVQLSTTWTALGRCYNGTSAMYINVPCPVYVTMFRSTFQSWTKSVVWYMTLGTSLCLLLMFNLRKSQCRTLCTRGMSSVSGYVPRISLYWLLYAVCTLHTTANMKCAFSCNFKTAYIFLMEAHSCCFM